MKKLKTAVVMTMAPEHAARYPHQFSGGQRQVLGTDEEIQKWTKEKF